MKNITLSARKAFAIMLSMTLIIVMIPLTAFASEADTSASWADAADTTWFDANNKKSEYEISTAEELAGFAKIMGTGESFRGITITLTKDIDLLGKKWKTAGVGTTSQSFCGVFDGNNHTIKNMTIKDDYVGSGFIRALQGATVKNLVFTNAAINGNGSVGIVAGISEKDSEISNVCIETGSISCSGYSTRAGKNIGGLTGNNIDSSIRKCTVKNLDIQGATDLGLLAGWSGIDRSSIEDCEAEGTVTGQNYVGGAAGSSYNTSFKNVYVDVSVLINSQLIDKEAMAGGLLGLSERDQVKHCHSKGSITHKGIYGGAVGGLIGSNQGGDVANCSSSVTVDKNAEAGYAGGLIGSYEVKANETAGSIKECYSTGKVKASDGSTVGGLIGLVDGNRDTDTGSVSITDCYSTSDVTTGGGYNASNLAAVAGGLIGKPMRGVTVKNCYALGSVTVGSETDSSGKNGIYGGRLMGKVSDKPVAITNCYYNMNSKLNVIGSQDAAFDDTGEGKKLYSMQTTTFVTTLNAGSTEGVWAASGSASPILSRNGRANYIEVETAKAKIPTNLTVYSEESVAALDAAVRNVIWTKNITEQAIVDGYAQAIKQAAASLSFVKPAEVANSAVDKTTTADLDTSVADGKSVAIVDQKTADKIVDKAISNQSKEIIIVGSSAKGDASSAVVRIPAETIKAIVADTDADIRIKTDIGEVTLDQKAAEAVVQTAVSGTVSLIIEKAKETKSLIQVELKVVIEKVCIVDFRDGKVRVTLALPAELKDKKVTCVYIDEKGRYKKVKGEKNADGTYTFVTGHFSTYAIMTEDAADKVMAKQKADRIKAGVKATTIKATSTAGKGYIRLRWTKSKGYKVDYYQVFRSKKKNSGYGTKAFYTTVTGTQNNYKNTKQVKKGTRYYYKVRGVRTVDGIKVYTRWSNKAYRIAR